MQIVSIGALPVPDILAVNPTVHPSNLTDLGETWFKYRCTSPGGVAVYQDLLVIVYASFQNRRYGS